LTPIFSDAMAQMDFPEESNHEVKADQNYAQILIEIGSSSEELVEIKKIIEESEIRIAEMKAFSTQSVLFKLDVKDIRPVALTLIEHGFSGIKGINALSYKE